MSSQAERVRDELRRLIVSGDLAPGAHLNEATIARDFGLSRVPVREAIRGLEAEGLAYARRYAGSYVTDLPLDEAIDLFDVRLAIEVATARRAAVRRAREGEQPSVEWLAARDAVGQILADGDEAFAAESFSRLPELNIRFHERIAELSGSSALIAQMRLISASVERLYAADFDRRGSVSWPEHREIVDGIDAGDAKRAAAAMRVHVRRSRQSYVAMRRGRTSA